MRNPWQALSPVTRDWLLILFYLGWGGPTLVIGSWLVWTSRVELTLIVGFNLFLLLGAVTGGLIILAERTGLLDSAAADDEDSAVD